MTNIELTQGKFAEIDDEDYDLASLNWCARKARKTFYAYRSDKGKLTALHQVIAKRMGLTGIADHIDGNGLNCKRGNLRAASTSQNAVNQVRSKPSSSGFRGVTWDRRTGKWSASLMVNYKRKHAGYFTDASEAARARDKLAIEVFGEFAVVNFP